MFAPLLMYGCNDLKNCFKYTRMMFWLRGTGRIPFVWQGQYYRLVFL
jgi:hypothetical protein